MPLAAGRSLTHDEILGPLGRGGMGEVYRARDTKLGREVAIKVLPEDLARDEDRLRRFEREARTLAARLERGALPLAEVLGDGTEFLVIEMLVRGTPEIVRWKGWEERAGDG